MLPQATSANTPAPVTPTDPQGLYLDVAGTGVVTPQDALTVIDSLAQPAAGNDLMSVTLQAQDPNTGAVLTQVQPGETFNLVAYEQDLRTIPLGAFAVFTNVTYNSNLATVSAQANITPGPDFTADPGPGITSTPGFIQDAGGIASSGTNAANDSPPEDPAGFLEVWSVPVTVPTSVASGQLMFTPGTSSGDGSQYDTLQYEDVAGASGNVPAASVDYIPAIVTVNGDQQATPTFSISPAQVTNSTTGTTTMTFNVSLSQAPAGTVTVTAQTQDGTGPTGAVSTGASPDYTANQQTFTFTPSDNTPALLTQQFTVTVSKATAIQLDKTFTVNLSSPTTGTALAAGESSAIGTIFNGDLPTLTVPPASVTTTGAADQTNVVFTVSLSAANPQPVTVDYAVKDGSGNHGATAAFNYTYTAGTLTIPANTTSATITVPIYAETNVGGSQTFTLNLFSPVHAQFNPASLTTLSATGTINEQPAATPTITVGAASVSNSATLDETLNFPVSLSSAAPAGGLTFQYYTTDGTGSTGAVSTGATPDYTGITLANAVTVMIPAGYTSGTIFVPVTVLPAAAIGEPNKTFTLNLTGASGGATFTAASVTGTILNTDFPTVSITNVTPATAPATGSTPYSFNVNLSTASQQTITLMYTLSGATYGTDYTTNSGSTTGTLTFGAGTTTLPVTVNLLSTAVNGDGLVLTLSNPSDVTIPTVAAGTATTTISTLPVATVTTTPGKNGAGTPVTFNVTLSKVAAQNVFISYYTTDGTASSVGNKDYTSQGTAGTPLTVTIPAGSLTTTITPSISIPVTAVSTIENNLTFTLNLSASNNATLAPSSTTVTGTIDNTNFPSTTITATTNSVTASPTSSTPYTFNVNLTPSNPQGGSVTYTLGGSAALNTDYTTASGLSTGTLTFPAGTTTLPVTVNVLNDTAFTTRTLTLTLSNGTNITIPAGAGTSTLSATINDVQVISVANQTLQAPASPAAATTMTFVAQLTSAAPVGGLTLNYSTADGPAGTGGAVAVGNTDYVPVPNGSITFLAGATTANFTVTINPQTEYELNKTFTINLSNAPTGYALGNTSATGTITPAFAPPTVSIVPVTSFVNANTTLAAGNATYAFTVNLSAMSSVPVVLTYTTVDGTAKAGTGSQFQYTATNSTTTPVTIPAGSTSATIDVPILPETVNEATSMFSVLVSAATNATLANGGVSATGTIDNQISLPNISVSSGTVTAGTTNTTFPITVSLTAGGQPTESGQAVSFTYTLTTRHRPRPWLRRPAERRLAPVSIT